MGFEIKNICTVVPNPHHPNYRDNNGHGDGYYYFSLFITPKLQFDGELKEFYEMLHWPEYVEKIFYPTKTNNDKLVLSDELGDNLPFVGLVTKNVFGQFFLEKDYYYLAKMCGVDKEIKYEKPHLLNFLKKGKKIWKKLFTENVPVEAWPIYLKPQISEKGENKDPQLTQGIKVKENQNITESADKVNSIKLQKKIREEKYIATKYRQEFHKKISALSRYPHILRMLGLIQDFKIYKPNLRDIISNDVSEFNVKLNFSLSTSDLKEFKKSIQFITPYTKCSLRDEEDNLIYTMGSKDDTIVSSRLRAFYASDEIIANYGSYVTNGFLQTTFLNDPVKEIPVFEVNQDYFEDRTQDFGKIIQDETANNGNNKETTKVVGINGKVFSEEDIEILKQKTNGKPNISKGFAIKVHSQPGSLLTGMDEKLKELTDDNIEDEDHAFMAHHLDCGYIIDVNVIQKINDTNGNIKSKESGFLSLCKRQAQYVVDRIDNPLDNNKIPYISNTLLENFEDEPWLEEVRLINNEGGQDRFEEIARWTGWSLTCPPLYNRNNNNEGNMEEDDLELLEVKPPQQSLPKLRFGNEYMFRIRTVDICGNGPDLCDPTDDSCIFKCMPNGVTNLSYKRLEPINPPLFFPPYEIIKNLAKNKENKDKKPRLKYRGEDNETLVIRTKIKKNGSPSSINEECIRYITPPYITMNFAETSGLLDNLKDQNKSLKEIYKLLESLPKHFYDKSEMEDNIPFLVDPEIRDVVVSKEVNKKIEIVDSKKFYDGIDPKENRPILFVLNAVHRNSQYSNKIYFHLVPGDYQINKVTSCGIDGSESVPKEFRLIHAVQKPRFLHKKSEEDRPYSIENNVVCLEKFLTFNKLDQNKTSNEKEKYQVHIDINKKVNENVNENENVNVNEKDFFPFTTTGELVLLASYNDYELNPKNPKGWSYISREYPKQKDDELFEGINDDHKEDPDDCLILNADKFNIRKSWSNLDESTENDKMDTILKDEDALSDLLETKTENKKLFNRFIHNFPDTKFRKVKYKLEAISKFSEFFDLKKHKINKSDKNPFSTWGDFKEPIPIKNSAKPSKPNITSIVPVFTTTAARKKNQYTYIFEHKTFRVYLGNTWYETGLGEKIAVTYYDINPKDENDFINKISIIANDPTTGIDSTNIYPKYDKNTINYIDSARVFADRRKQPLDSINLDLIDKTVDNMNKDSTTISKKYTKEEMKDFGFSSFDVQWDMERSEFYADILINASELNHYSTLLKFGICRYQENSILSRGNYDYRFSDVVMSDMVSMLPKREICKKNKSYIIEGEPGGRYIKKGGKLDWSPNWSPNIFYLISEPKKMEADNVSLLKNLSKDSIMTVMKVNLNSDILISTGKEHFIEEYENIPLNDDFTMYDEIDGHDNTPCDKNYNPRNDPRKRLVFFYKIPHKKI